MLVPARLSLALLLLLLAPRTPRAAGAPSSGHVGHSADTTAAAPPGSPRHDMSGMGHDHAAMPHPMARMARDMGTMPHSHAMPALEGPYPMTREASGTAWQPDAAPHAGRHFAHGPWSAMLHGDAALVFDSQGGPRGDQGVYASNMVRATATRPLGMVRLGLRGMLSAEPATIGKAGYPLLLQTGETADGRTPLIDRQHPHDLLMELAASAAWVGATRSLFLYAGLPGEPALGPPVYMHRASGAVFPEAPISHHWLDSSHITFGVVTLGGVARDVKLEASAFRGREPDQNRWNFETPKLDSYSFRLSWNPSERWALQGSFGRLESPEQLEPEVDVDRTTVSAIHAGLLGGRAWHTTLAFGQNRARPGPRLDAVLIESVLEAGDRATWFVRGERTRKDELLAAPDPRAGTTFTVGEITAGGEVRLVERSGIRVAAGVAGTISIVPTRLEADYGRNPSSVAFFLRAQLR